MADRLAGDMGLGTTIVTGKFWLTCVCMTWSVHLGWQYLGEEGHSSFLYKRYDEDAVIEELCGCGSQGSYSPFVGCV